MTTPIRCKRPPYLQPKAIGTSHVFNFFGPGGHLAVITAQGGIFIAYETFDGIELRTHDGETMNKGAVHRFIVQHLQALKDGAVPALLSCEAAKHSHRPCLCPRLLPSSLSHFPNLNSGRHLFENKNAAPNLSMHLLQDLLPPARYQQSDCTPPPASVAKAPPTDYI